MTRSGTSRGWIAFLAIAGVYTVAMAIVAGLRAHPDPAEGTSDFRDFWITAAAYSATGEIRSDLGVHNYLPVFTILMSPWSLLPLRLAAGLFVLCSLLLFVATSLLVERSLRGSLGESPRPAFVLAVLLMLPYVHSCAAVGAVGLLLLALIAGAWLLLQRGRDALAGGLLALATLIKLLPAALLVYLVLRRRWRALGSAVVVLLVLGLGVPLALLGPAETRVQHERFWREAVVGHSGVQTILEEKPVKANYSNSALPMVLRRLLSPLTASKSDDEWTVNVVDAPRGVIVGVYVAAMLVFGLGSVASVWSSRRSRAAGAERAEPAGSPKVDSRVSLAPPAGAAGFGAWCCLMLLATPLMWTHYLPLAYWALALSADRAFRGDARERRWAASAVACWGLGVVCLAYPPARAAGAQLFGVVALWLYCVVAAIALPQDTSDSSPIEGTASSA